MPVNVQDNRIVIQFPYKEALVEAVRTLPDRKWDRIEKYWWMPATPFHARTVIAKLGDQLKIGADVHLLTKRDQLPAECDPDLIESLSVNGLKPYPFQAVVVPFLDRLRGRALIADEVGLGKTIEALIWARHRKIRRFLVVCPGSVLYKWQTAISSWYPEAGLAQVIPDGRTKITGDVVILSYDMLIRKDKELMSRGFELIVLDECLPFHTPILTDRGWMPIGLVVDGKLDVRIASCDLSTNEVEWKRIVQHIKVVRHSRLVKVQHEHGSFICTEEHKVWTDRGYKTAITLDGDDYLRVLPEAFHNTNGWKSLQKAPFLRKCLCGEVESHPTILPGGEKEGRSEDSQSFARHQTTVCLRANETNERRPGVLREAGYRLSEISREQSNISSSRREWISYTPTTVDLDDVTGISYRVSDSDSISTRSVREFTTYVQGRFSDTVAKDSYRSGRTNAQDQKVDAPRSTQGSSFICSRVESITILERGDPDGLTICGGKDTFVYNIEVEDNHNYFASGVLVSNCHKLKNYKTKRFQSAKLVSGGVPHILGLSGTPILNRPIEMFNILNMLDPYAWGFWEYTRRYCWTERQGYQGSKNLPELEEKLRSIMIRRFKREVSDQLPAFQRTVVPFDLSPKQAETYRGLFIEDRDTIRREFPTSKGYFANTLDWLSAMRMWLERARSEPVIEWAEDFLESAEDTRKLVIYAEFRETHRRLQDALYKWGTLSITGEVDQKDRQGIIDRWQSETGERVMLLSSAGGEGIDLFGRGNIDSSTIVFAGRSWTPSQEEQVEGRLDRTGQQYPVEAVYLIASGTIDEDIHQLIEGKREVIRESVRLQEKNSIIGDLYQILERKGKKIVTGGKHKEI